jgi:excisionase family DNA binding protein
MVKHARTVYDSVEELAGELGISRATAYKGLQTGELPSIRIGRRFVIPREAIREMLRNPSGTSVYRGSVSPST